ncbi:MAG: T9SS type A sorting domain-containing protein [Ignavibacteriaceae bacterium]
MKNIKKILPLFISLFVFINVSWGQWVKTNGPWGGTVASCFTGNKDKLYAGSESQGIFLSTDKGMNWKSINSNLPDKSILSVLAIGDTIFAGTYNALFISTNGGESWNASGEGIPGNTRIYSLAVFDTILFAGTNPGGIYRSSDHGLTWIQVFSGISSASTMDFTQNNGKLFAVVELQGIFESTDLGITWTESFSTANNSRSIAVKDGIIYYGNIFSTNNGENWETSGLPLNDIIYGFEVIDSCIFAGIAGNGVSVSNNGKDWEPINKGLPDMSTYVLYSWDSILFVSTFNQGVFRSTNSGKNWYPTNLRFKDTYVNSLLIKGSNLFAGTIEGVYRTTDYGYNWIPLNSGLTSYYVNCLASNDSCIFAGTRNGLFKSTDDGLSWNTINSRLAGAYVRTLAANGKNIYAANLSDTLFFSSDNGRNWIPLTPLNLPFGGRFCPTSITVSDSKLFVGTGTNGIYCSTNNGTNWTNVNDGLTDLSIRSLVIYKNILYAGTYGHGVFLSSDDGDNWKAINKGLSNYPIFSLFISDTTFFAGNSMAVFSSQNDGNDWIEWKNGFPYAPVISSIVVQDSIVFAGTWVEGVWSLSLSNILTDTYEKKYQIISEFSFSQNYPNPFNPTTTITYSLPKNSFVTLKIYDLLGREVTTLVNEEKHSGSYKITWNAEDNPSGIYFYKLNAGGYSKVHKMILLK